jgi:hypothetical protein
MQYSENDKLDHLIGLAFWDCGAKDAEFFRNIDTSDIADNPRLDRKIHRLIKRKAREAAVKKKKRVAWRVAVATMLILSIMFAALMSISAIREAIWKTIVSWYENYITVQYEPPQATAPTDNTNVSVAPETSAGTSNNEVNNNGENNTDAVIVLPPTEILEIRKPTWLPEGTVEDVLGNDEWSVCIDYYINDTYIASFQQIVLKKYERYYNNETALIENFYIDKSEAIFVSYKDFLEKYIIWSDGSYIYTLTSENLNKEQMIQIAESVK